MDHPDIVTISCCLKGISKKLVLYGDFIIDCDGLQYLLSVAFKYYPNNPIKCAGKCNLNNKTTKFIEPNCFGLNC